MKLNILLVFTLTTLCSWSINTLAAPQSTEAIIHEVTELVEQSGIPGLALSVVRPDGCFWAQGFGYADLAAGEPMTIDSVINIASVSKTLTGVALMQLVEKGQVHLEDSINEHLPFKVINPRASNRDITIKHLLTHTTGIIDNSAIYFSPSVYHPGGDSPLQLGDFLRQYLTTEGEFYSASKNFAEHAPGTHFEYSNIAFALAGYLVERISGMDFSRFTRENILRPLGMRASGWKYNEVDSSALAKLYGIKGTQNGIPMSGDSIGQWRAYQRYGLTTYPDGGFRTSASDLSRFLAAIMNGGTYNGQQILRQENVAEMLTPQRFGHGKMSGLNQSEDQGLAFTFEAPVLLSSDWIYPGHAGGDPGVRTGMYFDPQREIGVIFLFNGDLFADDQLMAAQTIVKMMFVHGDALIGSADLACEA